MDNDHLKKIIECCHLNFLIGSGASKPFLGTLGTIEQLLTSLAEDENISGDERLIIDTSIKKYYFDVAIGGNLDLKESTSELELTKSNYRNFYSIINALLQRRQTNLISRQANIFTTNMDLFNEFTFEDNDLTYNDGFSGRLSPVFGTENFNNSIRKTSLHFEYQSEVPLFNLFKIHGSVNWLMSPGGKIYFDNNLDVLSNIKDVKFKDDDLLEIEYEQEDPITKKKCWLVYNLSGLKEQLIKKGVQRKDEHQRFIDAYDKIAMINPTKDKFESTTKKLNFYELLRMYSNTLEKENSVLFVFGFSFADEHIREITLRVTKANPTLLIVVFAYDKKVKTEIEALLPSKNNIVVLANNSEDTNYSLDVITAKHFKLILDSLSA